MLNPTTKDKRIYRKRGIRYINRVAGATSRPGRLASPAATMTMSGPMHEKQAIVSADLARLSHSFTFLVKSGRTCTHQMARNCPETPGISRTLSPPAFPLRVCVLLKPLGLNEGGNA